MSYVIYNEELGVFLGNNDDNSKLLIWSKSNCNTGYAPLILDKDLFVKEYISCLDNFPKKYKFIKVYPWFDDVGYISVIELCNTFSLDIIEPMFKYFLIYLEKEDCFGEA